MDSWLEAQLDVADTHVREDVVFVVVPLSRQWDLPSLILFDFRGIDNSSPVVLYTIGRFRFLVKWIRSVAWYIRMVPRLFPNTSLPKFRLGMTFISGALFHQ